MTTAGKISLKSARALALGFIVAVSGCTRPGASHRGESNAWTIPGNLRVAARQDPDNLNVLLGTEDVDDAIAAFWAAKLFRWSDRNELVPELAVAVPTVANGGVSADGLRITYHLRRNARWHDGVPFGADDVIYTWKQILNPRNFVVSRNGYDVVASIEKRDAGTIVVRLRRRYAPFVTTFFGPANPASMVLPEHLLARYSDINHADYNNHPIGTGPFRIVSYEKGRRIDMVANDAYWRGPPRLRRIEISIVPSDSTMLTLVQSHAIDFYFHASEALIASLRGVPGTRVVLTPRDRFTDIGLNAGRFPLSDVRVRRALSYATDRKALIDKVMHGVGLPGTTNHASFSPVYASDAMRYSYDPSRAVALLRAAGVTPGSLHLSLVSFTGSSTVAAAEAVLQSEWSQIGVDVTVKNFPSGRLYATLGMGGVEQSGMFDAALENWSNGADPDDSVLLACSMAPPAGWNIYHFCDHRLDVAEKRALTTTDPSVRKAQYATIQKIVAEQLPFIVLWYEVQVDVVNSDLHGYRPAHNVTPFWNTWEWSI